MLNPTTLGFYEDKKAAYAQQNTGQAIGVQQSRPSFLTVLDRLYEIGNLVTDIEHYLLGSQPEASSPMDATASPQPNGLVERMQAVAEDCSRVEDRIIQRLHRITDAVNQIG